MHLVVDDSTSSTAKDAFASRGGFLVIVQMLSSLQGAIDQAPDQNQSAEVWEDLRCQTYKLALLILSEVIKDHPANIKSFEEEVGWHGLQSALDMSRVPCTSPWASLAFLLALAMGDVSKYASSLRATLVSKVDEPTQSQISQQTTIEHPSVVPLVYRLHIRDDSSEEQLKSLCSALSGLLCSSPGNPVTLQSCDFSSVLLRDLMKSPKLFKNSVKRWVEDILEPLLLTNGLTDAAAAQLLRYCCTQKNRSGSDQWFNLLCRLAEKTSGANCLVFNTEPAAHASVAISSLAKAFPPSESTSNGWSFFSSIRLHQLYDEPIDLLSIFDTARTSSVRLSIAADGQAIHYQSDAEQPSVNFTGAQFEIGRLHHIAFVHERPRGNGRTSRAHLYIDGRHIEQQNAPWPAWPETGGGPMRAVIGVAPPSQINAPAERRHAAWDLGPLYMIDRCLPADFPLVLSHLGPSYTGNLQDSLGRFLSYEASTAINVRLDAVARGLAKDGPAAERELSRHPLVTAIAGKSSELFPEDCFYFALHTGCTRRRERPSRSGIVDLDPSHRAKPVVLVNQALPLTRDAVTSSSGYAKVFGDVTLSCPSRLEDGIWKAGGCAVLLQLIDAGWPLSQTLGLFFNLLRRSWRLCEDAEQVRAYEILNVLLRKKISEVDLDTLETLLKAVGLDSAKPEQSALVNPFLYRVIILDFDLWSKSRIEVQCAHLRHFSTLLKVSKHRRFNIKRVAKMQIVKRLLYRVQAREVNGELADCSIEALRALLVAAWSESSLKSATSFVATRLCERADRGKGHDLQPGLSLATVDDFALRVLELLSSLSLERASFLAKLGQTINIRWILLFFHPATDPRASVMVLELLACLVVRQTSYADRMSSAGGWKVLERLLPPLWTEPAVIPLCFSMLFRQERQPNTALIQAFAPPRTIACPAVLRIVVACLKMATSSGATAEAMHLHQHGRALKSSTDDAQVVPSSSHSSVHKSHRSNSISVDASTLSSVFAETSELVSIKETFALLLHHARDESWRRLLFAPATLAMLCEMMAPFAASIWQSKQGLSGDRGSRASFTRSQVSVQGCADLLSMLARTTVIELMATGSATSLKALLLAMPVQDLLARNALRAAATKEILGNIDQSLSTASARAAVPPSPSDSCVAELADFLTNCSYNIGFDPVAEAESVAQTLVQLLSLSSLEPMQSPTATRQDSIKSLHTTLNQITLLRLSFAQDVTVVGKVLGQVLHWQVLFLRSNPDPAFIECLLIRTLHFSCGSWPEEASGELLQAFQDVFKLIALSKPDVVECALPLGKSLDDVFASNGALLLDKSVIPRDQPLPFEHAWQSFAASIDALKVASHADEIEQVSETLQQSEAKQRAVTTTERRMMSWHASMVAAEADRRSKNAIDSQELQLSAEQEWLKLQDMLQQERGLLGWGKRVERFWQLDPTEGPRRMRKRLMEQPKRTDLDIAPVRAGTAMPQTPRPAQSNEEDLWGDKSNDMIVTEDPEDMASVRQEKESVALASPVEERDAMKGSLDASNDVGLEADDHEHKFRKVLRSLERGDKVEGVVNASRVVGIDCRAALCITGKLCLYLIDDYFQRTNGELVNVWQAPEAERDTHVLAALSSDSDQPSALLAQLEGDGQTRRWPWAALRRVHRRFFLHRRTALELFFDDGQSCLLVLPTVNQTVALYRDLGTRCRAAIIGAEQMRQGIREPAMAASPSVASESKMANFGARLGAALGRQQAGAITEAWRQRKISNFDYLMRLNTLAGRSFNDLSQYPVFPWIIADYTSNELDLNNPATFRDLELPMGAQDVERRKQFEERYQSLLEIHEAPFHYGTHFSTAATTAGFLIRLRPFEKLLIALQGGSFDLAERTFASIDKAWRSASQLSRGDIRELTPEFFYLPDFLVNANRFDFGSTQAGSKIDNVELPPWAKGSPLLFVQRNREALESDYVSSKLHHWIDLIFGFKQTGAEAVAAVNVFHPLSYADEVDLDSIKDPNERRAASQTVWNFGVCPARLFERPHVSRNGAQMTPASRQLENSATTSDFVATPWMAIQSIAPLRAIKSPSHFIYVDTSDPFGAATGEKSSAYVSPSDYLIMPHLGVSLSTSHLDGSLRLFRSGDPTTPIAVAEQVGTSRVTSIQQIFSDMIAIGCKDGMILLWKIDLARRELLPLGGSGSGGSGSQMQSQPSVWRGHQKAVTCIVASPAWRIAISGSEDGTAIVWDTNRGAYLRTLKVVPPASQGTQSAIAAVQHVAIEEADGFIATSTGSHDAQDEGVLSVWSVNGVLLARAAVGAKTMSSGEVTALAFLAPSSSPSLLAGGRLCVVLTGHPDGKVVAWSCEHKGLLSSPSNPSETKSQSSEPRHRRDEEQWRLVPFHVYEHNDRLGLNSQRSSPMGAITAIRHHVITAAADSSNSSTGACRTSVLYTGTSLGELYAWVFAGEGAFASSSSTVVAASGQTSTLSSDTQTGGSPLTSPTNSPQKLQSSKGSSAGLLSSCMGCKKRWGLLESRRICRGCGGVFCSQCAEVLSAQHRSGAMAANVMPGRWCQTCREIVMRAC